MSDSYLHVRKIFMSIVWSECRDEVNSDIYPLLDMIINRIVFSTKFSFILAHQCPNWLRNDFSWIFTWTIISHYYLCRGQKSSSLQNLVDMHQKCSLSRMVFYFTFSFVRCLGISEETKPSISCSRWQDHKMASQVSIGTSRWYRTISAPWTTPRPNILNSKGCTEQSQRFDESKGVCVL